MWKKSKWCSHENINCTMSKLIVDKLTTCKQGKLTNKLDSRWRIVFNKYSLRILLLYPSQILWSFLSIDTPNIFKDMDLFNRKIKPFTITLFYGFFEFEEILIPICFLCFFFINLAILKYIRSFFTIF